jgi:UDP-glucuronate 4-epimerase
VIGVDNLNDYYDVRLKEDRLKQLEPHAGFRFLKLDLADANALSDLFSAQRFERVVHLAAQAGVRYSLTNPQAYIQSNLVAFGNILECCRHHRIEHLVYASSSSVYGGNTRVPFSEHDNVDHPVSLYAATKKSNELMAHTYSHLFGLSTTGLRFFTVYGPWGRPDMSASLFARAIFEGRPIEVYNFGDMERDFTYVDDIVEGVVRVLDKPAAPDPFFDPAQPDPATASVPYRIYNIGNHQPVSLMEYIDELERTIGRKATRKLLPIQPGDVQRTCADTASLQQAVGFAPRTPLAQGLRAFVDWARGYYAYD